MTIHKFALTHFVLFLIIIISSPLTVNAQLLGLWEVKSVFVGEVVRTPEAKWVNFVNQKIVKSGNGWLQHTINEYTFEEDSAKLVINKNDEFGAFDISIQNDSMTWIRWENGLRVEVILARIDEIPKAVWDRVVGLWKVDKILENEKDFSEALNPQNNQYIFLTWARNYVHQNTLQGRKTGYWYIHPHRHQIDLLSETNVEDNSQWNIEFDGDNMIWTGTEKFGNAGRVMTFTPLDRFPETEQ